MRHANSGRKFDRDGSSRAAMFKNLLANLSSSRSSYSGMIGRIEFYDREIPEHGTMGVRGPDVIQWAFHFEPIATEARASERHRAAFAIVVVGRRQRGRIETKGLLVVQPSHELMHFGIEQWRVVVTQDVAGMSAATTIFGQLHC